MGNTISLLATGVVGIVNFVMTIPAVLFVDNFGRRPMLAIGEANMAISHATIAAIIAVYGGRFDQNKAAGNGAVFMVYWYVRLHFGWARADIQVHHLVRGDLGASCVGCVCRGVPA